jgi:hypothetical protein
MPMKTYPVPEKCLTGMLDNFGKTPTVGRGLYREAFGDNTLKFESHEESYMIDGFS